MLQFSFTREPKFGLVHCPLAGPLVPSLDLMDWGIHCAGRKREAVHRPRVFVNLSVLGGAHFSAELPNANPRGRGRAGILACWGNCSRGRRARDRLRRLLSSAVHPESAYERANSEHD